MRVGSHGLDDPLVLWQDVERALREASRFIRHDLVPVGKPRGNASECSGVRRPARDHEQHGSCSPYLVIETGASHFQMVFPRRIHVSLTFIKLTICSRCVTENPGKHFIQSRAVAPPASLFFPQMTSLVLRLVGPN